MRTNATLLLLVVPLCESRGLVVTAGLVVDDLCAVDESVCIVLSTRCVWTGTVCARRCAHSTEALCGDASRECHWWVQCGVCTSNCQTDDDCEGGNKCRKGSCAGDYKSGCWTPPPTGNSTNDREEGGGSLGPGGGLVEFTPEPTSKSTPPPSSAPTTSAAPTSAPIAPPSFAPSAFTAAPTPAVLCTDTLKGWVCTNGLECCTGVLPRTCACAARETTASPVEPPLPASRLSGGGEYEAETTAEAEPGAGGSANAPASANAGAGLYIALGAASVIGMVGMFAAAAAYALARRRGVKDERAAVALAAAAPAPAPGPPPQPVIWGGGWSTDVHGLPRPRTVSLTEFELSSIQTARRASSPAIDRRRTFSDPFPRLSPSHPQQRQRFAQEGGAELPPQEFLQELEVKLGALNRGP